MTNHGPVAVRTALRKMIGMSATETRHPAPGRWISSLLLWSVAALVLPGQALSWTGQVLGHQKISSTQGDFTGTLSNGNYFGWDTEALGDLDGDGVVDVAVGAPEDDDGGLDRGAMWILFLNSDGTVKSHQRISDTEGSFTGILDDEDLFGEWAGGLGDLDEDGVVDLAVGALLDDDGGMDRGALWMLFLNPNGTVKAHQKISDTEGNFTGELDDFDYFSVSPTPIGDLDNDGVVDLAVGAMQDDDGGSNRGAIWMLRLGELVPADPQTVSSAHQSLLLANVPNPFNPRTTIRYQLARSTDASIQIYDVAGRFVPGFQLGHQPAGVGSVAWDGRDDRGRDVTVGTYLARLVTSEGHDDMQLTLVR